MSRARVPKLKVWRTPLLLAALTIFGLLAALLGSGAWRVCAWMALGVPIAVALRYLVCAEQR